MQRTRFDTVQSDEGWEVKQGGKSVALHQTQEEAEEWAIKKARAIRTKGGLSQVVFHKSTGVIREERTFGKDPERHPG